MSRRSNRNTSTDDQPNPPAEAEDAAEAPGAEPLPGEPTAEDRPAPPPQDNDHVAEGAERFPEVKENVNDQTGMEPGKANAPLDMIEGRQNSQLALEGSEASNAPPLVDPNDPKGAPTHMAIHDSMTRSVDPVAAEAARDALAVSEAQAGAVKEAFVKEQRGETLDTFKPQRDEDVRVLVESNNHIDRSGDNVRESDAGKIVITDGVEEPRMIDEQPAGEVTEEFALGNGIRQTNLR